MPRSEKKKGFFGDEYTETRDDSGQKISESREKTGFFGDKYTETTDASGRKISESREKTGFFGDKYTETTDPSGRKVSESREKTGFFGDKYVETTDPSGRKISESRRRTGFFGDKYTETTETRRPRKPSTDWAALFDGDFSVLFGLAFKLSLWLAAFVFVIWLVMMALAITVMLAPIWLGAVTVGVITGFLLADSTARKLSEETLSRVPIVEEQRRKKTRFRVSEDFLKAAIKFSPHILSLIGATTLYCIALVGWPLFTKSNTFPQILLGVGSVAGTILGTLAGRRVLLWQYENRIFEHADAEVATRLIAPKLALGFSIPGLVALAGVGIFALIQSSGQFDFAKSLGFTNEAPASGRPLAGTSVSPPASVSPQQTKTGPKTSTVSCPPSVSLPGLLAKSSNGVFKCLKIQGDEGNTIVVQMVGEEPVTLLQGVPGGRAAAFSKTGSELVVDVGTGSLGSVIRSFRKKSQGQWQEVPNSITDAAVAYFRQQVADNSDRIPNHLYVNIESLTSRQLIGSISGDWSGPSGKRQFSTPFQLANPLGASSDETLAKGDSVSSFSADVVDGIAPGGGGFEGRSLVLRQGDAEIGRFPTFGYVMNFYASPDHRFVAVNNRRGNSGDYLWIIGADGRVLKRPEDELGQRIEREVVVRASRVAQQRSPEFQGHKTWINAFEWTGNSSLAVIVRTLHIIPNRDSLKQDVRVTLAVSRNGVSIKSIADPQEIASPEANVESFIRSRLQTEATHNLDQILDNYADRVDYWDNGVVDRNFIRKDKAAYFERWPSTREEIEGPISVTRNGDDWVATLKTRFRVENPEKGVSIQGIQQGTYTLRAFGKSFRIVGENGQVLEKQKFENVPAATVPQSWNYPGERFPETRLAPLSPQDLQKLSADDLRYAINEMFARYGADFPKAEVKRQFSRFSWYRPRPGLDFDEIESRFFSQLEKDNLKHLGEARESAGSRGSTAQSPVVGDRSDSSYSGVYFGESVKTKAGVRVTTSTRLEINGDFGTLRVSEVQVAPPGRRLNKEGSRTAEVICQYNGRLDNIDSAGFSFVVQRSRQLKSDPPGFWKFKSYDGYRIGVYAASGGLKIGTEDGEQFLRKQ